MKYEECSWTLSDSLHTVASHRHVRNHHAPAPEALSNTARYTHEFHASRSRQTAHSPTRHTAGRRFTWSAFTFNAVDKPGNEDIAAVEVFLGV